VPLNEWMQHDVRDFVMDVMTTRASYEREFVDNRVVVDNLQNEPQFGRKLWGLLSLEIWQQEFHDRESYFKNMVHSAEPQTPVQRHAA
jgi:asparagine synthase (glutamine-hydrolysing)